MTVGTNQADTASALGVGHHLHNTRKHRIAADLLASHHKSAGLIDRSTDQRGPDVLRDGHGFPGNHGFIDRAPPFHDDTVYRDLLARADSQDVAYHNLGKVYFLVAAVRGDAAGELR
jgi:hypothetical protein